jgi:hypothetical protein
MKLSELTDRWNLLGVAATAICTCISGFLILPPIDYGRDNWAHFGVFLVTAFVGLWSVPVTVWTSRRTVKLWVLATVFFVTLGTFSYFFYDRKMGLWTFEYGGQREVAGSRLSKGAENVKTDLTQAGRSATNHDIAWEMGGNFAEVWTDTDTRDRRLHWLLELYLAQLLLFASAMVTVVQASYCAKGPPLGGN